MTKAGGSLKEFTDLDRWHWFAYDYGWRRVFWSNFGTISTIDPDGDWFNGKLADEAEIHLRKVFRKPLAKHFERVTGEQIRDNCREIPQNQLTEAEREFLRPGFEAMMRNAKAMLGHAESKWRKAFRAPRSTHYDAPAEPLELADVTISDPALVERARQNIGIRLPYADDDAQQAAQ